MGASIANIIAMRRMMSCACPELLLDRLPLRRYSSEEAEDEPSERVDLFGGKISLLKNDFADLCLGSSARPRKALKAGSTVAHLAFYLAEHIGAQMGFDELAVWAFQQSLVLRPDGPVAQRNLDWILGRIER